MRYGNHVTITTTPRLLLPGHKTSLELAKTRPVQQDETEWGKKPPNKYDVVPSSFIATSGIDENNDNKTDC